MNTRNLTGPLCDEVNRHTDPQTLECPHFSTCYYLSIARPVAGFFVANNLHIFLQRTRTESPQINSTLNCHRYVKQRGLHVGIIEWLLVWLIVNALFVVWRILVTTEVETQFDQSARRCRWATFGVGYGIKSLKSASRPPTATPSLRSEHPSQPPSPSPAQFLCFVPALSQNHLEEIRWPKPGYSPNARSRRQSRRRRATVRDGLVPNQQLIIQPSGEKSYAIFPRVHGKQVKITSATPR